ncbi:hypothetical protein ES708_23894 [subsurface metagenome]
MIKIAKNKNFRRKDSYWANTPEAKGRQLAGRKRYYEDLRTEKKAIEVKKEPPKSPFDPTYENDIIRYLEDHYYIIETKAPVVLEDWQKKRIFMPLFSLNEDAIL